MIKTFTRNDMMRYFYSEMKNDESAEFKKALEENPGFKSEFKNLTDDLNQLDNIVMQPSEATIEKILKNSREWKSSKEKV